MVAVSRDGSQLYATNVNSATVTIAEKVAVTSFPPGREPAAPIPPQAAPLPTPVPAPDRATGGSSCPLPARVQALAGPLSRFPGNARA